MRLFRLALLIAFVALADFNYAAAPSSSGSEAPRSLPLFESIASGTGASVSAVFENPVLDRDFPDPAVIEVDGVFYSYATNSNRQNIPAARSQDLVAWTPLPDALPELAPWVQPRPNMIWAPEVIEIDGGFRMYYTARDRASNRQCIGVASSDGPEGPFRDTAGQALVCPPGFQRAIDPFPYADGKQLYLYFSGVCCGEPNGLYAQKLSQDGLAAVGDPVLVIKVDTAWEGSVAEAPTMLKRDSNHYLFYSGNDYRDQTYAVGYAVCKSAVGPCTKAKENPVLATGSSSSRAIGPGHQSVIKIDDDYWMFYHGWHGAAGYDRGGKRALWVQPLSWRAGKPIVSTGQKQ